MQRRHLIFGGASALLASAAPRPASALAQCSPMTPNGWQRCEAAIAGNVAMASAQTQYADQWCWAACLSVVFAYWGHPLSQARIVQETWGDVVNMPASADQILYDLNRPWVDDNGRSFQVSGDAYSTNPATAAQDLASNMPLIICTQGHAMVLMYLGYDRHISSQGNVFDARVMDPWPYSQRFRSLSPQEWYTVYMCARVRVYG